MVGDVDEISVVEGYQFTLSPSHTEMIVNNVIQWRFVPPNALLAESNKQTNRTAVYDDVLDGRFRDRLKLDNQTGSLTIRDIRTEHTGVFEVQNNNVRKSYIFTVNGELHFRFTCYIYSSFEDKYSLSFKHCFIVIFLNKD